MPPLSEADYAALKADIAERGIMVPIEVDEAGEVLDGHHRVRVCDELDIHCPRFVREGMDDAAKRTHARMLNIARRHLNSEQKRALMADELRSDAGRSDRHIGDALGVDGKTVGSVRSELEAGAEIPHHDERIGRDGVKQPVRRPFVTANTGKIEWHTPPRLLDRAREVLGGFDFDPASSAIANENVQAARYFTAEDDGLSQEWPIGRIWMNPPYSSALMKPFCERFALEMGRGSTGIVLVNNATETGWFNSLMANASAACFLRGRVRYLNDSGEEEGAPLQGQAIIYSGPSAQTFREQFSDSGFIVEPFT